ncbi:O-acetyl-ADP-ribose deacetylase (regulator of RNase III), contains Macro domain [Arboricoccus pini]|uniref:O-acetyl-ADP-ribose deacetylase (Regulator of RNase III), contains Macro domain n=1 Tax=Arboricoccus pini TaxID=1963835 RepID=A0A212PZE2_9PROT|nr:macro domain-containing protein [Arboricoccus pini]SNB52475.1 O-acetyl-ADP-ribose deacetylase (regulator of RNase III), contains Macro domain [Arboricoccus pini]
MIRFHSTGFQGRLKAVFEDVRSLMVDAVVIGRHEDFGSGNRAYEAVHGMAGDRLRAACRRFGRMPRGQARMTPAFGLTSRFVLHTACPVWRGGGRGEKDLLAGCYASSIEVAGKAKLRSLGIPEIATGIYSFPPEQTARIAVRAVASAIATAPSLKEVLFCCYSITALRFYEAEILELEREWGRSGQR